MEWTYSVSAGRSADLRERMQVIAVPSGLHKASLEIRNITASFQMQLPVE